MIKSVAWALFWPAVIVAVFAVCIGAMWAVVTWPVGSFVVLIGLLVLMPTWFGPRDADRR